MMDFSKLTHAEIRERLSPSDRWQYDYDMHERGSAVVAVDGNKLVAVPARNGNEPSAHNKGG